MLPPLDPDTGYLPPGIHDGTWDEIERLCGANSHRRSLLKGLRAALDNLAAAGCTCVYVDGSFVSSKDLPGDFDCAWEPSGVDGDLVDPVLLDFSNYRAAMKAKFGGELFPASWEAAPGVVFRDFFQFDRNDVPKGVIRINPRRLS
jgi:hypothetical protein